MKDEFLRRLRPMPRAAFVHELKGKLDCQSRSRSTFGGPAYLRTLLIALLVGGAAFAVTMLSSRRDSTMARVSAPVSQPRQVSNAVAGPVSPQSPAQSGKDELTPAVAHAIRREAGPSVVNVASAQPERPAEGGAATSVTSIVTQSPPSQGVAGIAVAGQGVRWVEGAGGAYPSPIYAAWGHAYRRLTNVDVAYVSAGSGGGVKILVQGGVTFAAVDVPMRAEELKASGFFQFPVLAGGVVPIVHLTGVTPSQVTLDAPTLARIYLGEISYWNDPPIQKLNPKLALPDTRITLAYRADASASTQLLTDYLSRSSPWFQGRYGVSTQIDVSPGSAVRGDDGMTDFVGHTDGAIGYVDYVYARKHAIQSIRLINKENRVVPATPESLQSAVTHADWLGTPGLGASLVDLPGEQTWPMTSASFVLMYGRTPRSGTGAALQFIDWAYRNGSQTAAELGYVTIPPTVADHVRATWKAAFGKGPPPGSDTQ